MGKLRDGVMKRGRSWSYVIRVTDPESGVSKPKWVGGFASEAAAKTARDEARVSARRGQYVDRNRVTVAEYLDEWIEAHAVEIRPNTLAAYRWYLDRYVKPRIGSMRLQAVRPATLSKLYRELHAGGGVNGQGLSVRTVNYAHAIIRKALNDAVRVDQLLPSNPAERAKRPRKEHKGKAAIWTPEQLRVFLEAARTHRLYAFFHLAAYTGARRGELCHLGWSEVDLEAAVVTVRGSSSVVDGARLEGATKGGRERTVSIDQGTVRVLREHRLRQDEERHAVGPGWASGEYVFTTSLGEPLHPSSPTHMMRRLINAHNAERPAEPLPHARLQDLRHVHATTLLLAGVPVHVVAERLGHADPAITLQVYAHVLRRQAAGTAEVFAAVIEDLRRGARTA